MTPQEEMTAPYSGDLHSLLEDIEFLTARIQALQDRPFAFASLREAKKQLSGKRKLLVANLREPGF
ncbi:hypothetical protein HBA55_16675 [Pseudomaricurvus alkylphenolicus]|jgi:hypothetical protein|uniref:hypothetical protein n=1 Tax=Pseudomaricurvus alkylphenolicus TaxID=1306991 RepID=UPI00141FBFF2|nr:hypothetical protein [Pseudomaricurvus alkylphenolicus]NIB41239.1 hypothetical protein [Pseudomaricurvus alkylphenolicus]